MYIVIFLLLCAIGYIFYLHTQREELIQLQKTITLLQEQILLFECIEKRINKLEKDGVSIIVLEDTKNVLNKNKTFIEILSNAYFKGWYRFSLKQREEIHANRKLVENKKTLW